MDVKKIILREKFTAKKYACTRQAYKIFYRYYLL